MLYYLKIFIKSFYDAGYYTVEHDGIEHSGYLAFLGMLSLFPALVLFVAIAGLFGNLETSIAFVNDALELLPQNVSRALVPRIHEITSGPPQGLLTVAIIGMVWTASSAVEGTRTILNRAYRVKTPPSYIWRRFMSILQFLGMTFATIIAMFFIIFMPIIWKYINQIVHLEINEISSVWIYLRYVVSSAIIFFVVAISYYVLPNIKQNWRAVIPGALIVLGAWFGAAYLLSLYLQTFNQVNLVYGSLGGVIAALLFFYVLGVIYIFGAEFNYFFDRALGFHFQQKIAVKEPSEKIESHLNVEE